MRAMTAAEREMMQKIVDDVYEQFLEAIWDGRRERLKEALARDGGREPSEVSDAEAFRHLRNIADGRIFSGRQARAYGLVDDLGGYEDALAAAARLAGLPGDRRAPSVRPPQRRRERTWLDYLTSALHLPVPASASRSDRVALQYILR
jgi:ClpP class serine protease